MREIKFRGKRIKIEDPMERWIEGSLINYTNIRNERVIRIMSRSGYMNDVNPETIGQFTGLLDKNGKEIYEGDIIQLDYITTIGKHRIGLSFEVKWCTREGCWVGWDGFTENNFQQAHKMFVVKGNIYDNPELLSNN
ncbi:YopX family protein [Parabacteroides provencensis]|uniref:YopX family protein n=1 Tax=Parabacteroides provencensis TaxID=1944636 RepID=UPI000C155F29|nr:YopX family protein [Parabacteroides provencensis]